MEATQLTGEPPNSAAKARFPVLQGPNAAPPSISPHDRISILHAKLTSEQVTLSEVLELLTLCIEQGSFKTAYQCVQHSLFVCVNCRLAKAEVFAAMKAGDYLSFH
jgi:hypothetical protein